MQYSLYKFLFRWRSKISCYHFNAPALYISSSLAKITILVIVYFITYFKPTFLFKKWKQSFIYALWHILCTNKSSFYGLFCIHKIYKTRKKFFYIFNVKNAIDQFYLMLEEWDILNTNISSGHEAELSVTFLMHLHSNSSTDCPK